MTSVSTPKNATFICSDASCVKSFTSLKLLHRHVRTVHSANEAGVDSSNEDSEIEAAIKCDFGECDKRFRTKKKLYDHKFNCHRITGRVYACDVCKCSFPTPSKLKKHAKTHEGYACDTNDCMFVAKTFSELRKHRSKAHTNQPRRCVKCGGMFRDLKKHERRVHGESKSIRCPQPECTAELPHRSLQKHLKEFHADSIPADSRSIYTDEERPYKCDVCPKSFAKTILLKKHVNRTHLRLEEATRKATTFQCPIDTCGRKFVSAIKFESHVNWHGNVKPYECSVENCARRFSGKLSLQRHLRQFHLTNFKKLSLVNQLTTQAEQKPVTDEVRQV